MTEQKPIPNKDFEEELEAKKGFWKFFYRWCEEKEREKESRQLGCSENHK